MVKGWDVVEGVDGGRGCEADAAVARIACRVSPI